MSTFIQKIKEKPEAYRKRFALTLSGSFAAAAFIVFAILFLQNYGEYASAKALEPKKPSTLSKVSKSYNEYKKGFDESDLAKRMEGATFSKDVTDLPDDTHKTTNASGTATTTITR